MRQISTLLELLKKQNEADDYGGLLKQVIMPTGELGGIGTLGGRMRDLSPMIAERFRFAGEWVNAAASQRWLSLEQTRTAGKKRQIVRLVQSRRKHWPSSAMAASRPDDLTLFGVDELEAEETYLVWGDLREPKVATYIEDEEQVFRDFRDYLSFLTAR